MPKLLCPKNLHKEIKQSPSNDMVEIGRGWFGHLDSYNHDSKNPFLIWTHCRDLFQDVSNKRLITHGMWFCHGNTKVENLCKFIEIIEEKLELDEKTIFRKTTLKNVVWLQPSSFWINDIVRKSFFTLALRCGTHYKGTKNNFINAMYQHYKISKKTKLAIEHFLNGNTWYTQTRPTANRIGWYCLFTDFDTSPMKKEKLETLLVKPPQSTSIK